MTTATAIEGSSDETGEAVGRGLPRWLDVAIAAGALALALPFLGLAALLVRLTSAGPALYRHQRVGRGGRPFTLLKLRTMRAAPGPQITSRGDARITPVGRLLRHWKLDELPSLWNVVRGDLALVGPRPEVPRYVDLADPLWRRVLAVRPGVTDPVTLALRNEEALLAAARDPDAYYRERLQPWKLAGYVEYLERRTAASDLRVLVATLSGVMAGGRWRPATAPPRPETNE